MTEHHIHIHLSSQGKQAAAEVQAAPATALGRGDYTRLNMVGILAAAFIGRGKGLHSKENAAELGGELADLILDRLGSTPELALIAAHVATGYIAHGQGHYKMTTIAERSCETVEGIPF